MQVKNYLHTTLFFLLLLLIVSGCNNYDKKEQDIKLVKEDFFEKCRKLVLEENKPNQEYSFKIAEKDIQEINVKYLGYIQTKNKDTIKFLNSILYFGLYKDSKRANNTIILYNNKNEYLGKYQVGTTTSLPEKIENTELLFLYNDNECNQSTKINFYDSIPKQIFVKCKGENGDIYIFEK